MTDIVERLRAEARFGILTPSTLESAADEIERLRAYNARLVVDACKAADEIESLRGLVETLARVVSNCIENHDVEWVEGDLDKHRELVARLGLT